eukprot:CAMPEP_0195538586 /NCGR_PEP_ID=MMETSP0794_2-20130614/49611_1 /TAXON_ID=515487 /ORGANISM="Stephanopyxis turris, Strain CCMP 815" /LENGTH=902 /DNA_ID=CAMNT_0040672583 /DNA_START=21 /DNA_END=2729 /DNA_ORIENTATION=+
MEYSAITIDLTIIQGRKLAAKDHKFFGKWNTSDPYVKVLFNDKEYHKTKYKKRTLSPVWNEKVRIALSHEEVLGIGNKIPELVLLLFDHDTLSTDDPMGCVSVPLPPGTEPTTEWYKVREGFGNMVCKDAKGEIKLTIAVKRQNSSIQRAPRDDVKDSINSPLTHEDLINIHGRAKENVFLRPVEISERFTPPIYPKSDAVVEFLNKSLGDNFIFSSLSKDEIKLFIDAMMQDVVPAKSTIIKQGDMGDFFYVVEKGRVSYIVDGDEVGVGSSGVCFGELALLYNSFRAATCTALTECTLWKVEQKIFRYIMANNTAQNIKDTHKILRRVSFLAELDAHILTKISEALTTVMFQEGDQIIMKGDVGEVFYIVKKGSAKVHDIGFGKTKFVDQTKGPGDFFGERALLTGEKRAANITATEECVCLCLSRDDFEKILGPLHELINRAMLKSLLMGVGIFANSEFKPYEMSRLTDLITETTFKKNAFIAEQGKPLEPSLFFIQSGEITVVKDNGSVKNLKNGDYFGERSVKSGNEITSNATITAIEDTVCGVLTKKSIESVVGSLSRLGKRMSTKSNLATIQLKELRQKAIIGQGSFGTVLLVKYLGSDKPYALKKLVKLDIIASQQEEGVMREKNVMASIDHPFIVKLVSTMQNVRNLYMLLELVQGGELFSVVHTNTRDGVPNANAVFYAACVFEALSHMHSRYICYRDLKPENVLVDSEGYCKVVDLGFAKVIMDKSFTLCGTPEYLAPELLLSKGHDKGVDIWALGIFIYEMLGGRTPFLPKNEDTADMFKKIVSVDYSFPENGVFNKFAQDLIKKLLVKKVGNRLGLLARGDNDIRDHSWFSTIDTGKLLKKEILAPWVPLIKDPFDTSHFDNYANDDDDDNRQMKKTPTDEQQKIFVGF